MMKELMCPKCFIDKYHEAAQGDEFDLDLFNSATECLLVQGEDSFDCPRCESTYGEWNYDREMEKVRTAFENELNDAIDKLEPFTPEWMKLRRMSRHAVLERAHALPPEELEKIGLLIEQVMKVSELEEALFVSRMNLQKGVKEALETTGYQRSLMENDNWPKCVRCAKPIDFDLVHMDEEGEPVTDVSLCSRCQRSSEESESK